MTDVSESTVAMNESEFILCKDLTIEVHWADVSVSVNAPSNDMDVVMSITSLIRTAFLSLPTNESTRKSYGLYEDEMRDNVTKGMKDTNLCSFRIPVPKILYMTLELIIPGYTKKDLNVVVHKTPYKR